jgi:prepilin-type processing-associated H-X9-DG protein
MSGVIFMESTIRLTDITDGISNTLLFAEWAHGILTDNATISSGLNRAPSDYQRWQVGPATGPQFEAFYPPNAYKKFGSVMADHATWNPTSFHPRGVNVALCDGSVQFIKETIDTWQNNPNTGYPPGISFRPDLGGINVIAPRTYSGVWQRLSTRHFGVVVSAGAF